jgi:hypothetical protein
MIEVEALAGMQGLNCSEPHKTKVLGKGHTKTDWDTRKNLFLYVKVKLSLCLTKYHAIKTSLA